MKKVILIYVILLIEKFLISPYNGASVIAQDSIPLSYNDIFKLSMDELFNLKVITADRTPTEIADIPASVVIISRDEIEAYGFQTLAEVLENVTGLYYIDDYCEGGKKFGIRGFWSDIANKNVMIQVNGIKQVDNFHSSYHLSFIPLPVESIDRIEVIRGPMSVIYGNGAFYGTINIITNSSTKNLVSGTIGTYGTKGLSGRISGESDAIKYSINASIQGTDGLNIELSKFMNNPSLLKDYGLTTNSTTKGLLGSKSKYLNFSGTFKDFTLNFSFSDATLHDYFLFPTISDECKMIFNATKMQGKYHKKLTKTCTVEASLGLLKNVGNYKYEVLFPGFYGYQTCSTDTWESEANLFYKPNDQLDIKAGIYYSSIFNANNQIDLPSYQIPDLENKHQYIAKGYSADTRAIFSELSYSPTDKLRFIGGIRLEQSPKYKLSSIHVLGNGFSERKEAMFDQDKIEFIPRLATIYQLNERHVLKFLYGKAINRPSFYQNTKNTLETNREDLEPEKIQTLEFNYMATTSDWSSINFSYFYNSLDNLISRIVKFDENNGYQSWSENAGKMNTHGVEVSIKIKPSDHFNLEGSGTYQKTKDKRIEFKDIDVAYSPNFLGYLKASYFRDHFSVGITGNYVGAMEPYWDQTKPDADGIIRSGGRIGDRTDARFIIGTNIRFRNILSNGWFVNMHISNILNTEFRFPTHQNNEWIDKGTIGMGRFISLSIGYEIY